MAARNAYSGRQRAEMRKAIKELREALQAQRDMLEDTEQGGGVKVWACGFGDTPQFLTRRKKPLFENNQTKIRPSTMPPVNSCRLGNNVYFKAICALSALLATTGANSQQAEIATCRSPAGKVFRHFSGIVEKADSGWSDEKISDGVLTLVRTSNGTLDMLFIDSRNKPISMTQDGAKLVLLSRLLKYSPASEPVQRL